MTLEGYPPKKVLTIKAGWGWGRCDKNWRPWWTLVKGVRSHSSTTGCGSSKTDINFLKITEYQTWNKNIPNQWALFVLYLFGGHTQPGLLLALPSRITPGEPYVILGTKPGFGWGWGRQSDSTECRVLAPNMLGVILCHLKNNKALFHCHW